MKKAKLYFLLTNLILIIIVFFSQIFLIFIIYRDLSSSYFKEKEGEVTTKIISLEEVKDSIEKIKSLNSY